MKADIITIGDELLIGQVVDTNSAWMAQRLNEAGVRVAQITSVQDSRECITAALNEAGRRSDIILLTGGLGPTKDDITKEALCDYFGTGLALNSDVLAAVTEFFRKRGKLLTGRNRGQAMVPEACTVIPNGEGTAPGMWFERSDKVFVSLPGVPYEMKPMMTDVVLPMLIKKFSMPAVVHRNIMTQGIGESFLADKLAEWEKHVEKAGLKLAYLPSLAGVRLRLSAAGKVRAGIAAAMDTLVAELSALVPEYIYAFQDEPIQETVGRMLRERKARLCTAESCTGGYLAHLITSVAGSSGYFAGSVVAYANSVKVGLLGVQQGTLDQHGAVSREVVLQMAAGARKSFGADFSLAVSGIAGPGGGSGEKPVGTVWIALAWAGGIQARKFSFGGDRERNIQSAAYAALNMLWQSQVAGQGRRNVRQSTMRSSDSNKR